MHSKRSFTKSIFPINLAKKVILLLSALLLSAFIFGFSAQSVNTTDAKLYFFQGYENLQNRNFIGAINEFTKAYTNDKDGLYGELAYLYLGKSYALLSYYSGKKEGVYSAIDFLNMYPFFYKGANYLNLQREFIGDSYLLLDMYDKAMDIFSNLYKRSGAPSYLVKLAYASVLAGNTDLELLANLNPKDLGEDEYIYYLVQGYSYFNLGNYPLSIDYLTKAREMNRYLEDDEHFLYRYAVSYYMLDNWKKAIFYMELLTRKDLYQKYRDFVDYYLALIYLKTDNYKDAFLRIENLTRNGLFSNPIARLLYSQLWAYPKFMENYKDEFSQYPNTLVKIAWMDINSQLSIPAILGLYYFSLKEKKVYDEDVLRLKRISLPKEIQIFGLKASLDPLLVVLKHTYENLDPYTEGSAELLSGLYKINRNNFLVLFSPEKLARALVYVGDTKSLDFSMYMNMSGPVGRFLAGQAMLLDGNQNGLNLIEESLKDLQGEDRLEALFILGIMKRNIKYLEEAIKENDSSPRLRGYIKPAIFELADIYYKNRNYARAKDLYKKLLETLQENEDMYWICVFRLAFSSKMLNDTQTLNWVIDKVKGKDNIISKAIVELWG